MQQYQVNIEELEVKMNNAGVNRTPFLFAVNNELTEGLFVEHPLQQNAILFRTPKATNIKIDSISSNSTEKLQVFPSSFEEYAKAFKLVRKAMEEGSVSVVNLTMKTKVSSPLTMEDIAKQSKSIYTLFVPEKFVCFSPERFVLLKDGCLSTNPMKGTINADIPDAKEKILNDPKEIKEHTIVVEQMKEELSKIASSVEVKRFRYVDHIKTNERNILEVSSELIANLPIEEKNHLGTLMLKLLPASSIAGVPKETSLSLLKEAEAKPRGYYTGIFGYFDGETLDSGVLIRYIEKEDDNLFFRSGGGVTIDSIAEREYNEVLEKIYLPL